MKQLNRWVYAIVGVIVLLFAGLVYAWSVLSTPIAAEFTSWTKAQLSLTFTIVMILFCIGSLLCGLLSGKLSAKMSVRIGAVLFLLAKHEADNTVVLGDNDRLFRRELTACRVNWIAGEVPAAAFRCTAKTRYSQVEAPALAEPLPEGRVRLTFDEPQRAITAGQAAVLYDGDEGLGGGTIE